MELCASQPHEDRAPVSVARVLPVLERHRTCALQGYDEAMMAQWGVEHHSMQEQDLDPSCKRPRTERTATDAVAYTSRCIGLSGFLRFQTQGPRHGWWLCDRDVQVQVQLLDTRPSQLESKVLVQSWTYCYGGPVVEAFLEVHAEPLGLEPRDEELSIDHVEAMLASHYPTRDPPHYSGRLSWRQAVRLTTDSPQSDQGKQQRRSHCVFGLVASVSPIAQPMDPDACHYFVEMQWIDQEMQTQSVVNVMFTGIGNVRWRPCLVIGKMALITDLIKVFSQDCGIFLLQATASLGNGDSLATQVMTWNVQRFSAPKLCVSIEGGVDFEGRVSGVRWDAWLELDGCEDQSALVSLLHIPFTKMLQRLRKGAVVQIKCAHLLRQPSPESCEQRFVLGLCPRSSLVVVRHAESNNPLVLASESDQRLRKKWMHLGDLCRQPLPLSLWLLELFDAFGRKFFLGLDALDRYAPSYLSFRYTRKRRLVRTLVHLLGVNLAQFRTKKETLGSRFLNDHSTGMNLCPSMKMLTSPVGARLVTLQELCGIGQKALEQAMSDSTFSVRIPQHDLQRYLLVGSIRGNVSSGDLHICDRTGSASLVLQESLDDVQNDLMDNVAEMCLFLVRNYELLVEKIDQSGAQSVHESLPVVVVSVICCVDSLRVVPMTTDIPKSQESVDESDHSDPHVIFVTHINPPAKLPLNGIGVRLRTSYRHVLGIAFPESSIGHEDSSKLLASMYAAEFLINEATCTHWYVEKYRYYRLTQVLPDDQEVQAEEAGTGLAVTVMETIEQKCIRTLVTFQYRHSLHSSDDSMESISESLQNFHYEDSLTTESARLKVQSLEFPCQILPLAFDSSRDQISVPCDQNGLLRFLVSDESSSEVESVQLPIKSKSIEASRHNLILCSLLRHFASRMERIQHVDQFLVHPAPESKNVSDVHKARLVSVVGVVTERKFFWKPHKAVTPAYTDVAYTDVGGKRLLRTSNWMEAPTLMCSCRIRDLRSINTVDLYINVSRFNGTATLVPDSIVEASMLQSFTARSNYKVYTNWCHRSAGRRMRAIIPVLSTLELQALLPSTHLSQLYSSCIVDKRLYRWIVRVVHITYVLLKRRCKTCYQSLKFVKRQAVWHHTVSPSSSRPTKSKRCLWQRMKVSDSRFEASTFLATTVRCIVDDGSAQAELFVENDAAWELLQCSAGQRHRFKDMLRMQVAEISFFTGHASATNYFTPDAHSAVDAYCQNELRAMVLQAMPRLRSIVVLGQRFYNSSSKSKELRASTTSSVLTFGKDVHLTTKTATNVQLEARRVDLLHVRSGIRELLQRNKKQQVVCS